jgi:hypothetical protein
LTDYLTFCPSLLIFRNIVGVKEEKLSFMIFPGVGCLLLLFFFNAAIGTIWWVID